jgi:TetR/AcrR family transcriptional repressor of lmrAB and yxaGH operons
MPAAPKHKANLVDTAVTLFRRQGYAATGLNQIIALSGAPKGSLYHYFPGGKEALGAAAVALAGEVVARTLERLRRDTGGGGPFIQRYCELLAKWMEDSDFHSGCPIATTLLETCPDSAAIRTAGEQAIESWIAVMQQAIDPASRDPDASRSTALLVISAVEGALILARTSASAEPINRVGRKLQQVVQD